MTETLDRVVEPAKGAPDESSLSAVVDDLHLLDRYKVITDKVWEEVWITELEARVLDTREFQRLRWVLQLGAALWVYPNATHTRFEHILGTLEATERIIFSCNVNAKSYGTTYVKSYPHLLARLAALAHDLAQMPFAHTLDADGEGHLFATEWKNKALADKLLSKEGVIERTLSEFFDGKQSVLVEELRKDLTWILVEGGDSKAAPPVGHAYLRYLADVVNNTLCADLVDYVQRDLLSVGFRDRIALRALHFFVIKEVNKMPRLVLALWKPNAPAKMRRDVISEAVEFLRKRYSLAERVYFHHAKMAASAMIIKSVENAGLKCEEVWQYGDYGLLSHLEGLKLPDGKENPYASLVHSLLERDIFKLAYEFTRSDIAEPGDPVQKVKDNYSKGTNGRKNQKWLEENLAVCLDIQPQDVAIYSPDPDMNLKEFKALVWPKASETPLPLMDLSQAKTDSEELMAKHRGLWRLAVFVRKEVLANPQTASRIERFCRAVLEVDRPETQTLAEIYVDSHEMQFLKDKRPWEDRTQAVNAVRAILDGKPRGQFAFPRVEDVIAAMKK